MICDGDVCRFYSAVRAFYSTAATYALKNLPIKDDVLFNAQFVNVEQRSTFTVTQVMYFVERCVHDCNLIIMHAIYWAGVYDNLH